MSFAEATPYGPPRRIEVHAHKCDEDVQDHEEQQLREHTDVMPCKCGSVPGGDAYALRLFVRGLA